MALCRELHFTRAAEKLNIAQPSLSQQIRLLEHEIGMPLFNRSGKRTVMTEAGNILLQHCYNIFHETAYSIHITSYIQMSCKPLLRFKYNRPLTIKLFNRYYKNNRLNLSLEFGCFSDGEEERALELKQLEYR
ncbi:LysR family transcriptional regulator [Bacillus licheniformis]|nr:LysR family transcriptional regulator [Bacillus licheniformis]